METLKPFSGASLKHKISGQIALENGLLRLKFAWEDSDNEIQFQLNQAPQRTPELWKTTCFEAFLQPVGQNRYFEVNLASSGAWEAYEFSSYRSPQPPQQTAKIQLTDFKKMNNSIEAQFSIDDGHLDWNCSLTAVIELKTTQKYYLATKHAGDKPDFHLHESFSLRRKQI